MAADPIVSYSSMLSYMVDIPTASPQMKEQALRQAGRKVCLDTELYKKTLDPINVVAGTRTYDLSSLLPTETRIIRLGEVRYGENATDDTTNQWDQSNYELEDEDTFKFVNTPQASITNGLVVEVILRPTVESIALESYFFDRYMEGILAYAKYYLLRMDSNKGWADKARADGYLEEYEYWRAKFTREKYYEKKSVDVFVQKVPGRF